MTQLNFYIFFLKDKFIDFISIFFYAFQLNEGFFCYIYSDISLFILYKIMMYK